MDAHVYNPLKPGKSIGRRTGKPICKKRNVDKSTDNFSDYLSDSDDERSVNVTTYTPLVSTENLKPSKDQAVQSSDDMSVQANDSVVPAKDKRGADVHSTVKDLVSDRFVNPLIPSSRFGRRTGKDLLAGKMSRILSSGMENFSDFLSDSDASMSLQVTPTILQAKLSTSLTFAKESDTNSSQRTDPSLEKVHNRGVDKASPKTIQTKNISQVQAMDAKSYGGDVPDSDELTDDSDQMVTRRSVSNRKTPSKKNSQKSKNDISQPRESETEGDKSAIAAETNVNSTSILKNIKSKRTENNSLVTNKSQCEEQIHVGKQTAMPTEDGIYVSEDCMADGNKSTIFEGEIASGETVNKKKMLKSQQHESHHSQSVEMVDVALGDTRMNAHEVSALKSNYNKQCAQSNEEMVTTTKDTNICADNTSMSQGTNNWQGTSKNSSFMNKSHNIRQSQKKEDQRTKAEVNMSEKVVDSESVESDGSSQTEYVILNAGLDREELCASDEGKSAEVIDKGLLNLTKDVKVSDKSVHEPDRQDEVLVQVACAQSKIPVLKGSKKYSHSMSHLTDKHSSILIAGESAKGHQTEKTQFSSNDNSSPVAAKVQNKVMVKQAEVMETISEGSAEKSHAKTSTSGGSAQVSYKSGGCTDQLTSAIKSSQTTNPACLTELTTRTVKSTASTLDFGGNITGSVSNAEKAHPSHFFGIKKRLSYSCALIDSSEKEHGEMRAVNAKQVEEITTHKGQRKSLASFLDHHDAQRDDYSNLMIQERPMVSLAPRAKSQLVSHASERKSAYKDNLNVSNASSDFCIVEDDIIVAAPGTAKTERNKKQPRRLRSVKTKDNGDISTNDNERVVSIDSKKSPEIISLQEFPGDSTIVESERNTCEPEKSNKRKNGSDSNHDKIIHSKGARKKIVTEIEADDRLTSEKENLGQDKNDNVHSFLASHIHPGVGKNQTLKMVDMAEEEEVKISSHNVDEATNFKKCGHDKKRNHQVKKQSPSKRKQDGGVDINSKKPKTNAHDNHKQNVSKAYREKNEDLSVHTENSEEKTGTNEERLKSTLLKEDERDKKQTRVGIRQKAELSQFPYQTERRGKLRNKHNSKAIQTSRARPKSQTIKNARDWRKVRLRGQTTVRTRMQTRAAHKLNKTGNKVAVTTENADENNSNTDNSHQIHEAQVTIQANEEPEKLEKPIRDVGNGLHPLDMTQQYKKSRDKSNNLKLTRTTGKGQEGKATHRDSSFNNSMNTILDGQHENCVNTSTGNKVTAGELISLRKSFYLEEENFVAHDSGYEFMDCSNTQAQDGSRIKHKGTARKTKTVRKSRGKSHQQNDREFNCNINQSQNQSNLQDAVRSHHDHEVVDYTAPLKTSSQKKRNNRKRTARSERLSAKISSSAKKLSQQEADDEESTPLRLNLLSSLPKVTPQSGVSFRRSQCYTSARQEIDCPSQNQTPRSLKSVSAKLQGTPVGLTSCLRDPGSVSRGRKGRKVRISNIVRHKESTPSQSDSSATTLLSPSASPVHYAETTRNFDISSKSPKYTLPDLSHRIVKPKGEEGTGLQRSKRTRVKRLNAFTEEGVVLYRRDSTGFGLLVDSIQPNVTKAKIEALEERRRKNMKQNKLKSMTLPAKPKKRLSTHWKDDQDLTIATEIPLVNPDTQEEVVVDVIAHKDSASWVGSDMAPVIGTEPIAVCLLLQQPGFTTGEMQMRPLAEKPRERTTQTLVFNVVQGKVCLTINQVSTVVQTGDDFFIPQGTWYSMKNMRRDIAILHFLDLGDTDHNGTEDFDNETS